MHRRVSFRSLATSLPLLLLVALVGAGRQRNTPRPAPAHAPLATPAALAVVPGASRSPVALAVVPSATRSPVALALEGPLAAGGASPTPADLSSTTLAPSPTPLPSATLAPTPTATPTPSPTQAASPTPTVQPTETPLPTPTPLSPAVSTLRIVAIEYASNDEYVEIANQGPLDEPMTGWQLASAGQKTPYTFPPGYILPAGAHVRVHSGRDALNSPPSDLRWSRAHLWNNDGDEAWLYDAVGNLVDRWAY
jgi:hypothetical protein